jgi:hypothetical protein
MSAAASSPFGARSAGVSPALAEESAHTTLKPILKVIGAQTLVTPGVLQAGALDWSVLLLRPEVALKSVPPEAVRHEELAGANVFTSTRCPLPENPKLSKRQKEI